MFNFNLTEVVIILLAVIFCSFLIFLFLLGMIEALRGFVKGEPMHTLRNYGFNDDVAINDFQLNAHNEEIDSKKKLPPPENTFVLKSTSVDKGLETQSSNVKRN